jgi:hypothetical protein
MSDEEIAFILEKRKQFVRDVDGFHRRFVFIKLNKGKLEIGHELGDGKYGPTTPIEFDDLDIWINYFDRI